jgi:hypothetical protein
MGRTFEEVVVVYFKVLSRKALGVLKVNHENLRHDIRDWNPVPPEYEAGMRK